MRTTLDAEAVVAELPRVNRAVIEVLLEFIRGKLLRPDVVERTKMNAENLATIFGPCILCFGHAHNSDPSTIPSCTAEQTSWTPRFLDPMPQVG